MLPVSMPRDGQNKSKCSNAMKTTTSDKSQDPEITFLKQKPTSSPEVFTNVATTEVLTVTHGVIMIFDDLENITLGTTKTDKWYR